jgi:hypothetical protein
MTVENNKIHSASTLYCWLSTHLEFNEIFSLKNVYFVASTKHKKTDLISAD